MKIPVRSLCHRCFRDMKNYHCLLPDNDFFDPEYAKKQFPIHLDTDELLVGIYENKHGEVIFKNIDGKIWNNIAITDKGLHLFSEIEFQTIYYKDIEKIEWSKSKIKQKIRKGGLQTLLGLWQLLCRNSFKRGSFDFRNVSDDLTLYIHLKNNKTIALPILYTSGKYGGSKYVVEFERFLIRVVNEQREPSDGDKEL